MAGNAYLKAQAIEDRNQRALVGLRAYYQDCLKDENKIKEIDQKLERLAPKDLNIPLEKF